MEGFACGRQCLVRLNAVSFHNPSALYVNLYSENLKNIPTLIDSGSTDCLIDSPFGLANNLKIENLKKPLRLTLFDSSTTSSGLFYQFTCQRLPLSCGTPTKSSSYSLLWIDRPLPSWDIHGYTCRIHWLIG